MVTVVSDGLPVVYDSYKKQATLADEFEISQPNLCCVTAGSAGAPWPSLVIAQSRTVAGPGFDVGVALVPETKTLFVGAAERILAYRLDPPERLWEDTVDAGFFSWAVFENTVLMAAELELAAWDHDAKKLWTTYVEPPWTYAVEGDRVYLDVMGRKSDFPILTGPQSPEVRGRDEG